MTKEQLIFKNMKKHGRIYKSHGKFGIGYSALYVSIKEAGYENEATIKKIIDAMINGGYLRYSRAKANKGLKFIIEKWVN